MYVAISQDSSRVFSSSSRLVRFIGNREDWESTKKKLRPNYLICTLRSAPFILHVWPEAQLPWAAFAAVAKARRVVAVYFIIVLLVTGQC